MYSLFFALVWNDNNKWLGFIVIMLYKTFRPIGMFSYALYHER